MSMQTEPATTDRMVDMRGEAARRRRRGVLRALWAAVLLLIAAQAGAAYYLYRGRMAARAAAAAEITEEQMAGQRAVVRSMLREGKIDAAEVHLEGLLARKPGHLATQRLLTQVRALRATRPPRRPDAALLAGSQPAGGDGAPLDGGAPDVTPDRVAVAHARGDRPRGDRPRGDRPRGDRPRGDRPRGDRPGKEPPGKEPPGKTPPGKTPPGKEPPDKTQDPAVAEPPTVAKPGVRDLTLGKKELGNAASGAQTFRMGCGLCHGRTARAFGPTRYSAKGWVRYFASGAHGRHTLLRSNFTRSELADVKAYLVSEAK